MSVELGFWSGFWIVSFVYIIWFRNERGRRKE